MLKFSIAFFTDRANRNDNEDAILIYNEIFQPETMENPLVRDLCRSGEFPLCVLAVADGMGGQKKEEAGGSDNISIMIARCAMSDLRYEI